MCWADYNLSVDSNQNVESKQKSVESRNENVEFKILQNRSVGLMTPIGDGGKPDNAFNYSVFFQWFTGTIDHFEPFTFYITKSIFCYVKDRQLSYLL